MPQIFLIYKLIILKGSSHLPASYLTALKVKTLHLSVFVRFVSVTDHFVSSTKSSLSRSLPVLSILLGNISCFFLA